MKKWLHKKYGWFDCRLSYYYYVKSVDKVEFNEYGGAYVNLTLKCYVCGREEKCFQTRSQKAIPSVGDTIGLPYRHYYDEKDDIINENIKPVNILR